MKKPQKPKNLEILTIELLAERLLQTEARLSALERQLEQPVVLWSMDTVTETGRG